MSLAEPVRTHRRARPHHAAWTPTRSLWLDLAWIDQHLAALRRSLRVQAWDTARTHSDVVHALVACHVEWEIELLSRVSLAVAAVHQHDRLLDAARDLGRTLAAIPPGCEAAPALALAHLETELADHATRVERELYPLVERDPHVRQDRAALAARWRETMSCAYVVPL